MTPRHPSDLALETYLLERDRAPVAPHVAECLACRSRLARMEKEGQDFLQYVYPATVEKVEEAAARRPAWLKLAYFVPVPLAAAAAALFFVFSPGSTPIDAPPDYVGVKGGAASLGLSVFLGAVEGAKHLSDGAAIPADAALRFKVQPSKACHLFVVSVDGSGQVSRLYPAAGEQGARLEHGGPLPGGARLDGRAGPERIFAVCDGEGLTYTALERAVQGAVARGESAVRSIGVIPGLPDGTAQTSVLIEKKSP
jgi:hypothetical protein